MRKELVGRFLAVDPVGYSEQKLYSFNRYAYANNKKVVNRFSDYLVCFGTFGKDHRLCVHGRKSYPLLLPERGSPDPNSGFVVSPGLSPLVSGAFFCLRFSKARVSAVFIGWVSATSETLSTPRVVDDVHPTFVQVRRTARLSSVASRSKLKCQPFGQLLAGVIDALFFQCGKGLHGGGGGVLGKVTSYFFQDRARRAAA